MKLVISPATVSMEAMIIVMMSILFSSFNIFCLLAFLLLFLLECMLLFFLEIF